MAYRSPQVSASMNTQHFHPLRLGRIEVLMGALTLSRIHRQENDMPIRPLTDHVLIRRKEGAAKVGAIIVPDGHREKPQEAVVVAVGNKCVDVKEGNSVLFAKYAGTEVKAVDGEGLLIMIREEDILAVVE